MPGTVLGTKDMAANNFKSSALILLTFWWE